MTKLTAIRIGMVGRKKLPPGEGSQHVSISLPKKLWAKIDEAAEANGVSRSQWILERVQGEFEK